jgi:single-strand DNA-binding protein
MQGKIKVIGEVVVVSEKFKKRDLVLTFEGGQFPQDRLHQLTQDKVSLIDGYKVGELVNVSINYNGREWTSPTGEVKYFNTDEVWKIERVDGSGETIQQKAPEPIIEEDDLPF